MKLGFLLVTLFTAMMVFLYKKLILQMLYDEINKQWVHISFYYHLFNIWFILKNPNTICTKYMYRQGLVITFTANTNTRFAIGVYNDTFTRLHFLINIQNFR